MSFHLKSALIWTVIFVIGYFFGNHQTPRIRARRSVEDFYAEEEWKDGRENAQGLVDILLAKVAVGPTNQNDDSNNTTSADHKPANVTSREMACVFRTSRMPGAPSVRPKLKIVAVGDTSFARDILGWGEAQYKGNMR
eukprot:m.1247153 g.1247153  ORF g.1247153 m.1247153 type:complete len:138 (+) comp24690_c1_seq7:498-911(+)